MLDNLPEWQVRVANCLISANTLAAEMASMGVSPDDALVTSASLLVHHAKVYDLPLARMIQCIEHIYLVYDLPPEMISDLVIIYAKAREAQKRTTKH